MAFVSENLNVIAYANGLTLWNYVTDDKPQALSSENYFAVAEADLRSGDMIIFHCKSPSESAGGILFVRDIKEKYALTELLCASA